MNKQAADIAGAFHVILTLMTPVILITAVIVALDMDALFNFWQQTPGSSEASDSAFISSTHHARGL